MSWRAAVAGVSAAAAVALPASFVAGGTAASLCSSGFVDAVVGGVHKCLHAGEFCSASEQPAYERYGFACVGGRLQARRRAPVTPPTPLASGHYDPPVARRHAGCRVRGNLPDPACSPGAVLAAATAGRVCVPGYSRSLRNVPESERRAVFAEYGIPENGTAYEVDHLISLELGGSNSIANLWPEAASPRPGFHEKDRLENRLHGLVCDGALTLRRAQELIATNWATAYRQLVP